MTTASPTAAFVRCPVVSANAATKCSRVDALISTNVHGNSALTTRRAETRRAASDATVRLAMRDLVATAPKMNVSRPYPLCLNPNFCDWRSLQRAVRSSLREQMRIVESRWLGNSLLFRSTSTTLPTFLVRILPVHWQFEYLR